MTTLGPPRMPVTERERRALLRAWSWDLQSDVRPTGRRSWRVPSRTEPGLLHAVTLTRRRGKERLICSCEAGTMDLPCTHAAAVWLWRQAQRGVVVSGIRPSS